MKDGTPYYDLYVGSSNSLSRIDHATRMEFKVSSLKVDGELVGQFQDEIDSHRWPIPFHDRKSGSNSMRKISRNTPYRVKEILQSFEGHDIQPNAMQQECWRISRNFVNKASTAQLSCRLPAPERRTFPHSDVRECQPKRMLYIAQQQMIFKTQ